MYRARFVKSASFTLLFITVVVAVVSACSADAFDPCRSNPAQLQSRGQLDGIWGATTINGQPAAGYSLPFPSTDDLVTGSIEFMTRETQGKDCDDLDVSTGYAVARYVLRRPDNTVKPAKRYVGRFKYLHKSHTLEVTAAGYSLSGSVSGNTMTLPASHALFGNATLVLQR